MTPSDLIYKGTANKLRDAYPKAKETLIASCAGIARDYFKNHSNFKKGRVFEECYDVALKKFKVLVKINK